MNSASSNGARGSKKAWRRLPLVAILALSLVGTGANAASASTTSTSTVAFPSFVVGKVTSTDPTTFALVGIGIANQLGIVSYAGTVVITSSDPVTGVITDTLTETLTAANSGDSITLLSQDTATPIGSGGLLQGVDQWTVTGGTGQFSAATGSGTNYTYILNWSAFLKTSTGTISY